MDRNNVEDLMMDLDELTSKRRALDSAIATTKHNLMQAIVKLGYFDMLKLDVARIRQIAYSK